MMYDFEMPKFEGATDIAQAVIDTGTTLIGIPPDQHQYVVGMWKQTFGAEISCDNVVCFAPPEPDCAIYTSRMKPVQIMFDNEHVFEIAPEGYTMLADGYCVFGLMEFSREKKTSLKKGGPEKVQKQGAYLLGGVFLRHFYTVFNWDSQQVEFAVNKEAQHRARILPAGEAFAAHGKKSPLLESMVVNGPEKPMNATNQRALNHLMSADDFGFAQARRTDGSLPVEAMAPESVNMPV
jgi:hypothetical protein